MKATKDFERTIQSYLEKRASEDALFAERYANPKKNISDCCTYILNTVKSSGRNGFTDAEVFGMAVHYYDEDDIKVGNPISCQVVVNHVIELTAEEKQQARQKAFEQAQKEAYESITKKKKSAKQPAQASEQPCLFQL